MNRTSSFDWSEALVLVAVLALALVTRAVAQEDAEKKPDGATVETPYAPKGELTFIKLDEKTNKKLTDGTSAVEGNVEGNTLESLPKGEQTFAGVKFNISGGLIQLRSVNRPRWPKVVEGIPVDGRFAHLYILHATQSGSEKPKEGLLIGKYVVHYEDDSEATIPIIYGKDVRDWWNFDESAEVKRSKVGWVGSNAATKQFGLKLRLYVSKWDNPKPGVKVAGIDYTSANMGQAGPFCVAMTVEAAE